MSARLNVAEPDAAIALTKESLDLAGLAESWVNHRISPMVEAIIELAAFSSEVAHKSNRRIELIRDIAKELSMLVDEAGGQFEREQRDFEQKLAQLEGGAA
jgi:hypothetical protein